MTEKETTSQRHQKITLMTPVQLYTGCQMDFHNDTFFIFIRKNGQIYPINIHKDLKEEIIPYSLYCLKQFTDDGCQDGLAKQQD